MTRRSLKEKRRRHRIKFEFRLKRNAYVRNRRKTDPYFRVTENLRSRLRRGLKGNFKSGSAIHDLGCTIAEFKEYIEAKFYNDMSWDNYGKYWQLDHIKELRTFDLTNPDQLKQAVHYTNLQPLTSQDHRKKTSTYLVSQSPQN